MMRIFLDSSGNTSRARMNHESNKMRTGLFFITGVRPRTSAIAMVGLLRLPEAGTERDTIGSTYFLPALPSTLTPGVTRHCARRNCGRLVFFLRDRGE